MKNLFRNVATTVGLLVLGMTLTMAAPLNLTVENIRTNEGRIAIAVFNNESGFPNDDSKAVKRVFVPLQKADQATSITINDLAPGQCAIALFHDNNLSGKLETNLFGIPSKGYGFSNNVNPSLRSARFDEAVFTLPEQGGSMKIKLIYRQITKNSLLTPSRPMSWQDKTRRSG